MDPYNFLSSTRAVIAAARDEAARLRHEYVGTEHILLALLRQRNCAAASVLQALRVDLDKLCTAIEDVAKPGHAPDRFGEQLPYTSRSKKVMELAMKSARDDDHAPVGTVHLLLGILREEKGIAAQLLAQTGVRRELVIAAARNERREA